MNDETSKRKTSTYDVLATLIKQNKKMGHQTELSKASYAAILKRLQEPCSLDFEKDIHQLVAIYYDKMITSLMAKGANPDLAADVVQDFVLHKLLNKNFLAKVDLDRGQFESFIISCLYRFFIDQVRKQKREKESLHKFAQDNLNELAHENDKAGRTMTRRWALTIFGNVIRKLKLELLETGKEVQWRLFAIKYIRPMRDGKRKPRNHSIGEIVGRTWHTISKAAGIPLEKTRERFVHLLKDELKIHHGSLQDDLEEQFKRLKSILVEPGAWLEDWKEVLPQECHWNEEDLPTERWSNCSGECTQGIDVRELFGGRIPYPVVTQQETAFIWVTVRNQPFDQFLKDYLSDLGDSFPSTPLEKHVLSSFVTLEHLDLVRKAAKSGMQSGELPYLAPIFHMLYALSIAKSFNEYGVRISRMNDKDIVNTLQYAQQQSWIPDLIQREIEIAIRGLMAWKQDFS